MYEEKDTKQIWQESRGVSIDIHPDCSIRLSFFKNMKIATKSLGEYLVNLYARSKPYKYLFTAIV